MSDPAVRVLLVEDNPGDARLIQEMLKETGSGSFAIEWVTRLADGLARLGKGDIDLVLLDLGLPDSRGIDTFFKAYAHAPEIPFVLLTGLNDETLALTAVRQGAQDYLLKGETDGNALFRAIRYAAERKKVQEDLRRAHDELERRVDERTSELLLANQQLIEEIEKRKETEAALQASEARYRAIFESTGAGTIIVDGNRTICLVNDEFEKLSGFSRKEIEGKKSIEEFLSPGDLEQIREFRHLRCLEPSVPPSTYEIRFKDRGGRMIDICLTASMIPGNFTSVGSLLDITDRKKAESALKIAHDNLELKVAMRTMELARANAELQAEIEERQRAQAATEAERQRLFALLEGLPNFVYLKTPDYRILFANRAFREIFGEIAGKHCYEAVAKKTAPCEVCPLGEVLKTNRPHQRDWTWSGGTRSYQVHHYPFADTDGSPLVLTLGFDITERKQAEVELRQSQARMVEAQRLARLGSWEWNVHENRTIYSDEMFRILSLPIRSEGLNYEEFFAYVHPEDREALKKAINEALSGDRPYDADCRLVLGDGSPRLVRLQAKTVFDQRGQPVLMQGTMQDVTEAREAAERLRASEERFRAVFESAAIGIAVADARGRILAANPALQQMTGYRGDELFSRTFLDITHPEDGPESLRHFQQLMVGASNQYQIEKRYLRKDGGFFWARATVSTIKGVDARPVFSIAVIEDITRGKLAEEKLRESEQNLHYLATRLLNAQETERQRIAMDLHDDLGQSLMVLKLQLRAIERELPASLQDIREELSAGTADVDEIIENVRRLSRDLRPTILEDLGLTVALKRLFEEFGAHNSIECRVKMDDLGNSLPPEAQINIYRVFQESLTNVAKHSQATRVSLTIKKQGNKVCFAIEDNGKGFDADSLLSGKIPKQGMGLAAMEERMRMIGGSLQIRTQEGQGCSISFEVPCGQ